MRRRVTLKMTFERVSFSLYCIEVNLKLITIYIFPGGGGKPTRYQ